MFYRFNSGNFVEADSFLEAQEIAIHLIQQETEEPRKWHKCTCLGLQHPIGCPEHSWVD
jgi:hypothetical protein